MPDLLLVDNDRRIVELAAWFLERRGFVVRTALSYRDARVAIRERCPDLMLADLELGEENGREELPRLASEGILPKTLVVSGFLDAELDAELRRIDAVVDTLPKPYDMSGLEQRILACLELSALPELPDGTEDAASDLEMAAENSVESPDFADWPATPADALETSASALPKVSNAGAEPREPSSLAEPEDDDEGWVEIVPFRREPGGDA
jgi:DNA-binding response OmpR family regulator